MYSICKLHLFHCPQLCGESRFGLNERIIPFQVSLCFSYLVRATFLFTFTWLCFYSFQGWPLSTARPLRKQATKQLDSSLPTAKSFRDSLFSMVSYFRHVSSKMWKGEEYIDRDHVLYIKWLFLTVVAQSTRGLDNRAFKKIEKVLLGYSVANIVLNCSQTLRLVYELSPICCCLNFFSMCPFMVKPNKHIKLVWTLWGVQLWLWKQLYNVFRGCEEACQVGKK